MTENEMAMAMPRVPHIYGDVSVKYAAVSILEPLPVINMTNPVMTEPGRRRCWRRIWITLAYSNVQ